MFERGRLATALASGMTLLVSGLLLGVAVVEAKSAGPITAEARAQASTIYSSRCATCHGDKGRGDGPAAENLNPRPVNFRGRAWQRSVTDSQIAHAIIYGGKSVGLSGEMAPNPDLENEPAIVAALVERVRQFGR